jgi:T4-like virus Myoviridae tail sheath stabiliser
MLSGQHFYYRTIRRNVIAFGTLFKNIQMSRYAANTFTEISRVNVPLTYSGKENFLTRLLANPDLKNPTQIVLPRMSFEMTGINYDSSRKLSSYMSSFNKVDSGSVNQQYQGVPYNLDFELTIYVRNVEDGTQIVEQIFPYFNPDYTLSMNFVDAMNIKRDVPILLESVNYQPSYEGPADTTVRILIWTLKFKMKTYFFGPINVGKIIRQVTANTFSYTDTPESIVELTLNPGFGDYRTGETIYQGANLPDSPVNAQVLNWNPVGNILTITGINGKFDVGANVVGSLSKASHSVIGMAPTTTLLDSIVVTPNPPTANLGDDFGFTEVNNEYPNI